MPNLLCNQAILALSGLFFHTGSAWAQQQAKLVVYNDAIFTKANGLVTASSSATDESVGMGPGDPCNHYNYQTCSFLTPPDGVQQTSCVAGLGTDNVISVGQSFGEYTATGSASATCSCIGPFGGGGPGDAVDVPGISALQDYNSLNGSYASPFVPAVDTPQNQHWVFAWGNGFTNNGTGSPTTTLDGQSVSGGWASSGGFHLGSPSYVSETKMQYPYYVDASATVTSHTITITTPVGSASASFNVGDATPVITKLSQNSFQAGSTYTGVVVSGNNLGTTCPTVTITGGANTTFTPTMCSDTSVTGTVAVDPNADPDAPGNTSASLTVKSNGFGQGWQPQAGASQVSTALDVYFTPPPPPTISLTLNGALVSANSTVYINPTPALNLSAVLVPARQGLNLSGNASWSLSINYAAPGAETYNCDLTITVAASSAWNIANSFGGYFCGNQAILSVTYQSYTQSLPFTILGQNPTVAAVKAALGASPWFIQQLANSESPGYLQFQSNGQPVYGPSNGYGIMQLDYQNTIWELWTWNINVSQGLAQNAADQPGAISHWNSSVAGWNAWNVANPKAQVAMQSNINEGPCTFSYSPVAGQHPFSDAIWIKMYNSGTSYWYLTFSNGSWVVNSTNGSSFDYVFRVCSTVA